MARKLASQIIGCIMVVGLSFGMVSCSTPEDPETPDTEQPTHNEPLPSTTIDGIEVTGAFGEEPTVVVPEGWSITSTQAQIITQGDGPAAFVTGLIQANYVGINGRTGEIFDSSWERGAPVTFALNQVVPGFQKGLNGQKVGTRVLIAMPGADGYDANGGQESAGIEIGDTLVFLVDILKAQYPEPTGTQIPANDPQMPTVTGPLDAPEVTIPQGVEAPTELKVQVLVEGDGPEITAMDTMAVNYAEYLWTGTMIRQTYGFEPLMGYLMGTIPGWQEGLVGLNVGSRVLLVVPPELGYPEGNPKIGIPEGSTSVFVIDILYSAQG
ncbi:MAG: FKBP-type peptidyl-prolyl cis-trans isomerase [Propionibacteriaceae bacterium]|nr:FKBP-type peptidyl-prolyl cis-trans isomerase [Propionibacteriaceae bacterium]